jgi:hypothetical protein
MFAREGAVVTVASGISSTAFAWVRAVADAVLYEGYVLYPYRKSSAKNRVRWQFGVLAPKQWLAGQGPLDETSLAGSAESWFQQTECLAEAQPLAAVTVRLRFLQVLAKTVERRVGGGYEPVDALETGGHRHVSFDEALPREHDVAATVADLLAGERQFRVAFGGREEAEDLPGGTGRIVRRSEPVGGFVTMSAQAVAAPFPLVRLRVRVENTVGSMPRETPREQALRRAMVATHTVLAISDGEFLSLLDPPQWAAAAARECTNVHAFPVLAGPPGTGSLMLSAPIILYDHVQVAPESPGDLHDGGEIDEILSLRTLTLTEAEKAEARATDPRTAAIVDRVDVMPPEVFGKLHGAIRSLRPVSTAPDGMIVDGHRITIGATVRLRPRRHGTDAQDMFLAGRTATVSDILLDVDGSRFVAVTLDDDPGRDVLAAYGRSYQFAPDEIEAVDDRVRDRDRDRLQERPNT